MEGKFLYLLNNGGLPTAGGMSAGRSGRHRKQLVRKPETLQRVLHVSAVNMARKEESLVKLGLPTTVVVTGEATTTTKMMYDDNWFHQLAIHYLSQSVQAVTGVRNNKSGYESLIEAATVVGRNFDAKGQQELVIQVLRRAFPESILSSIRTILPPSKFKREYFAIFTTLFFSWLVGPCEVKESKFQGRSERNVVYIKKCRFLEATSCVGMCTNMCKVSSQRFIKDSLGVPVNMVPNFEDMSCEMIFGQHPPAEIDDPAFSQPCFQTLCKVKQSHGVDCSGT